MPYFNLYRNIKLSLVIIIIATIWLNNVSVPVSEVPGRQMSVPRVRRSTFGTRAFSVAGPTVWNSLSDHLRDPAVDSKQFSRNLKTYLFTGHLKR